MNKKYEALAEVYARVDGCFRRNQLLSGHIDRIYALAACLPPFDYSLFEVPLGGTPGFADLGVSISSELERSWLLDDWDASGRQADLSVLSSLCREWCRPGSIFRDNTTIFGMEFDLHTNSSGTGIPSIFYDMEGVRSQYAETGDTMLWRDWLRDSYSFIKKQELPEEVINKAIDCIDKLPRYAYLWCMGLMLPRRQQGIRLCFKLLKQEQVIPFLREIGWQGSFDTLDYIMGLIKEHSVYQVLGIDIAEGIEPRIGLEARLSYDSMHREMWDSFMSLLVREGLCTIPQKDAVLEWEGHTDISSNPVNCSEDKKSDIICRKINHVKFISDGEHLTAKCYLSLFHGVKPREQA